MTSKEDVKKIVEYEKKSHSKLLKDTQMVGREDLDLISILQDLERLEELEKENQKLKEEMETLKEYDMELFATAFKLKKAIKIIKDKLKLSLNDNKANKTINAVLPIGNNDMNRLTQEEYELLKEVIKNGRDNKISD